MNKEKSTSEKILLRVPKDLQAHLKSESTKKGRTLTSEIVWRLQQSVLMDQMADKIIDVEQKVHENDADAAQAMLPYAEKIKAISAEYVAQAKRDVALIEGAADGKIRAMISEAFEDVLKRIGLVGKK
jgi:hypothetical protein